MPLPLQDSEIVHIPLILANSCASPEELSEIVRETLAAIQMRRRKISFSDVEKCLGLSSSQVMNLFMKYRIERISEGWDGTDWRQWAAWS